jgi:hypothetical protein
VTVHTASESNKQWYAAGYTSSFSRLVAFCPAALRTFDHDLDHQDCLQVLVKALTPTTGRGSRRQESSRRFAVADSCAESSNARHRYAKHCEPSNYIQHPMTLISGPIDLPLPGLSSKTINTDHDLLARLQLVLVSLACSFVRGNRMRSNSVDQTLSDRKEPWIHLTTNVATNLGIATMTRHRQQSILAADRSFVDTPVAHCEQVQFPASWFL